MIPQYDKGRYYGVPCGHCGSRRTRRIAGAVRQCQTCGKSGILRVSFDNLKDLVSVEPFKEMAR